MQARNRQQNGWVLPTGKKPRTWTGYFYRTEDGKRRKKSKVLGLRTEMNKGQAEDALRAYLRDGLLGEAGPDTTTVVKDSFALEIERYLRSKRLDWGKHNRAVMASLFALHVVPTLGQQPTADITTSEVKEWITRLGEKYSRSLCQKALCYVRAVFEALVDDGKLGRNPARKVKLPKNLRKPDGTYLEVADVQALLGAAEGTDKLILDLLYSYGLRPSELFALRLEDAHPGALRIDEGAVPCDVVKDTKTEESDGWVPLSADLGARIRTHAEAHGITDPKAFLFATRNGTPISHNNWRRRNLKPLAKRAAEALASEQGLDGAAAHSFVATFCKRVNFWTARRTVGTHAQKHGEIKSAQGLLRHRRPETTLIHYQQKLAPEVVKMAEGWRSELTSGR